MTVTDDFTARTPESHADEIGGRAAASGPGLFQAFTRFVEQLSGSADRLFEVYADRLRLSVRRKLARAAIGAGVAIFMAVWMGAAALATLRGACAGLTAMWGGREWLGDLTGGVLALALAASAMTLAARLSSRRELGRLRAKYERIRSKRSRDQKTTTPAVDGGRAPRQRGSDGDPGHHGLGATLG